MESSGAYTADRAAALSVILPERCVQKLETLERLANRTHARRRDIHAQIWRLSVTQKGYEDVSVYLDKIAEKQATSIQALVNEHKLSPRDLENEP